MVRTWSVIPLPLQVAQGSSTTEPLPRHSRHGSENANAPWLRLVTPAPWQTGHVCGAVPGFAPLPWQVGHEPGLCMRSGTVTPSTASSKASVASVSTSCPRAGPEAACCRLRVLPAAPPPPKRPPKRSPRPPPRDPRALPRRAEEVAEVEGLAGAAARAVATGRREAPPPGRNPPPANSRRASSYSLRFWVSERTP